MKRELMLGGPMALFASVGLLALHALPGFGGSGYSYVTDACVAVLLLAYGDQILLTVLLVLVQAGQQLTRLGSLIKTVNLRPGRHADVSAHAEKTWRSGVNLSPLLMAVLLIIAGTLSPSDGVDSGRFLSSAVLLSRALVILVIGIGCFLAYIRWYNKKMGDVAGLKSQSEAVAKPANEGSRFFEEVA